MNLLFVSQFLHAVSCFNAVMTDNNVYNSSNAGNFNENPPYVVGILSPSTTFYIDHQQADNRNVVPPSDLNLRRRNTNSFQITSVTVQGSRKNEDFADDSADDLDESRTDDLSSDFLDSSRADNDGYHSEDNTNPACDDLSPCGPIIFAQLPGLRDPNMNLSIGVTPTYTAVGPNIVAGGVTMMTSKSESPVTAQVPIMNPLPDNWQKRFKVVKIVSSEPFKRGRWLCMDFKDPPNVQPGPESIYNGQNTLPLIHVTHCDIDNPQRDSNVYEIPISETQNGNFVISNQQQMYGILLPQNGQVEPVTLVHDMSIQTAAILDANSNHIDVQSVVPVLVPPQLPNENTQTSTVVNSIPKQSSQSANPLHQVALSQSNAQDAGTNSAPSTTNSSVQSLMADTALFKNNLERDESESAASTGSNTVAIDNKIEQAMDLVKSHLMFAVREEVEVLKEKITELLERISQLEHENDILRANASAETLKQLNNQSQKKISSGGAATKQQQVAPVLPPST